METFGGTLFARWISDFDCGYETKFWACILDKPFDLQELKAKRRYEITKGNKNFYCETLSNKNLNEMYSVYVESLEGYTEHGAPLSCETFNKSWSSAIREEGALLIGAFEKDTNQLCGFAHCIDHGKYIPISTLKTRVSKEKIGVNFALVFGICEYYKENIEKGSYLCDGWRNVLHDTTFQSWLEKYFQFRKAYCILHIKYRGIITGIVRILYPVRRWIKNLCPQKIKNKIEAVFNMEEWSREGT